ncbi:PorP/SprF family type IX secretion system membrane protein [Bacteroidales bacterium]|nr:PorP/SprF family type IX secretion system membrane protein [Bacteroidales bacterium]
MIKLEYKYNIVWIVGLMLMYCLHGNAQQEPHYTHFMYTQMSNNPGYAGSQDKVFASVVQRNQYLGLIDEGAPVTTLATVNAPFKLLGKEHGVGISVINDAIGFDQNVIVRLGYAYRTDLGDGKLGIGGGLFVNNISTDNSNWRPSEDNANGEYWGAFSMSDGSAFNMDLDLGLYYKYNDLYFGVSGTRLLQTNYKLQQGGTTGTKGADNPSVPNARHLYLTAGYLFQLSNPSFELQPNVMIEKGGASTQYNINTTLIYNKKFWGGLTLRNPEMGIMAGIEMSNNLRLGVAYDVVLSGLGTASKGNVEILINYSFEIKKEKIPQRYKSIRYL